MEQTVHEFVGKWITTAEFADLQPVNIFHRQLEPLKPELEAQITALQNSHILFRRKFDAAAGRQTVLYISADDYYFYRVDTDGSCLGSLANKSRCVSPAFRLAD